MTEKTHTPPNLRTLRILEILGQSDKAMTATEINAEMQLPKQSIHRLCTTLEDEGFIIRQGRSRHYQIARRLREMGSGLLYNSRDHIMRRQILVEVGQAVNETVNFVIPRENGMQYLDRVESDWAFQIQLPIGVNVPFHCTASGKCFMASLSPKKRANFVSALSLGKMTDKTHIDPQLLLEELKIIARQGYALDQEEFIDGMVAIAVPVQDNLGRFVAAVAFHGPIQRLAIDKMIEQKPILIDAAHRLKELIFETE